MKLVISWKLKSRVDKGDVREKRTEGRLKKKKIVKHEREMVIILTFEFEQISRSFNLYFLF